MRSFTKMFISSILLSYMVLLSSMLGVAADSGRYAERVSTVDRVDVIELNYRYDEQGKLVFRQFIFWDYDVCFKKYVVREWALIEDSVRGELAFTIWENPLTLENHLVYKDREYGFRRHIIAGSYRVSHAQSDPELVSKKTFSENLREKLSVPSWLIAKLYKAQVAQPLPIENVP